MTDRAQLAALSCSILIFIPACASVNSATPIAANASSSVALGERRSERVTISQFDDLVAEQGYFPTALTVGPDAAFWVTDDVDQDYGESAVVRVEANGKRTATFYFQNSASPAFEGIAAGSDGALWMADSGDGLIVRMTTTGLFTVFQVAGYGDPSAIVAGPDQALWFVDVFVGGSAVGRITTSGEMTTFTKGISPHAVLQDIAVGSDGALWFTESTGNRIGRVTTDGTITEYSKGISPGAQPYSIAPGPDGALWFTELAGGRIGRITTRGRVTEYSRGITPTEQPQDLAAGPDGAMWFTEYESYDSYSVRDSKIGRITMSGTIAEYSNFDSTSAPTGIVAGRDGNMWFVETNANRVGRVNL
jgi:virginiamycin B lyase